MQLPYQIIDFHTHPFLENDTNICSHKSYCKMSAADTKERLRSLGIQTICGSVLGKRFTPETPTAWEEIRSCNDKALALRDLYGDFYVPGFHIHPHYIKQSCDEIERMHACGVKLVGELVPYWHGWQDYASKAFAELLDVCAQYQMIVSFHSMGEAAMDNMVRKHPNVTFVAAHPGEYDAFSRHIARMKQNDNYYLDLSGYGIFRHAMLRHAIDVCGAERFLFGSDYPTCNPAMYVGGVALDYLLTEREKELIFSENAKRLLHLTTKNRAD